VFSARSESEKKKTAFKDSDCKFKQGYNEGKKFHLLRAGDCRQRMNGCYEGFNFLSSLFASLQSQCQWRSFLLGLPNCLHVISVLVL